MTALVYIRSNCSLCERVCAALEAAGVRVRVVDISKDSALDARYRYAVPVVEVGGIERLRAPFTEGELRTMVDAARGSDEGA